MCVEVLCCAVSQSAVCVRACVRACVCVCVCVCVCDVHWKVYMCSTLGWQCRVHDITAKWY